MSIPTPPYRPEARQFGAGDGVTRLVKRYAPGSAGDILTDEEVRLWAYVDHLEAENKRLTADLEAMTAPTQDAKPATAKKVGK